LIFVEIALVTGLAGSIQDLLDPSAPKVDLHLADTAIFYSISSAQKGLAGVSFGNFLIKQVIDDLGHEFPNVHTFATLSPIPGFRRWIERAAARGEPLLDPAEAHALADLAGVMDGAVALVGLMGDRHWHENPATAAALKPILLRLCARYLLVERSDGRALDPVAHFHLSNGARVGRLDWLGDRLAKGLDQSAGLMVNYLYELREIEDNHEAYTGEGRVIASNTVKSLL
jgi:malonyl-CoA decarboxylase